MFKYLKQSGPGAIVASATIGAGETVLAVRVGAWGGYDFLCLILLVGTVTATLLTGPDVKEILSGLFRFGRLPPYPDWLPAEITDRSQLLELASVFGYAGSIPMNYIVYSNWVLLKGWTLGRKRSSRSDLSHALGPLRWDVGFNAVLVFIVTVAFMIAGVAILRSLHRIPNGFDLLTEQAQIFAQISPAMIWLYYVTTLTALWGTLNALPDIYARGAHSFLSQLLSKGKDLEYRKVMNIFGPIMLGLTWRRSGWIDNSFPIYGSHGGSGGPLSQLPL